MDDFPLLLEEPVSYCGFNSPKSYGGNSYFIQHPEGNWLIDSPKFLPRLVNRFEALGGIAHIFLTHRDDVADAHLYARHFGSRRIIHRDELTSQPEAEVVLDGEEPLAGEALGLSADFLVIPTPGHTRGHCVLLFRQRFLFTGDHLDWDRHSRRLNASFDYCWYSWARQTESMRRLAGFSFEWVLPGHGQRVQLPQKEMGRQMEELTARMPEMVLETSGLLRELLPYYNVQDDDQGTGTFPPRSEDSEELMADPTDRRGAECFPVNADACCPFLSPVEETHTPVKIRDISMAGIGLLISRRIEPGALLALTLSNPARNFTKTVLVRVVHATTLHGNYLIGGTFTVPLTYQEMTTLVL